MIEAFVKAWEERKQEVEMAFKHKMPDEYGEIVKTVVGILSETDDWKVPDPDRITTIDYGDYQGTLLFIIAATGYQPHEFWYVLVSYGSCSGCDTLEDIRSAGCYYDSDSEENNPNPDQLKDLMTLALHVVQGLKYMGDEDVV